MINKKKKGFTLIELIIVVAIIGILIAIALPKFSDATTGANNRKIEANARTLAGAVQQHFAVEGNYNIVPEKIKEKAGLKGDEKNFYTVEVNTKDADKMGEVTVTFDGTSKKIQYTGDKAEGKATGTKVTFKF